MKSWIFICTMALTLAFTETLGQKVGLVMSGGGAKGIAHVGVIKALEEYDIPIDYVVGTSMGGIVAGCYAAGYSAQQIEGIMLSPSFIKWVNGEFEKGYNYHIYKDETNSSFASIRLSLDSTLNATVNSSLASDITLNFALPEYLSRASAIANNNFDSLYVPARIVAADVFTQSEMILKKASLPLALRTTLSVPFFYKPIKIDNQYLFDGGIYNNFPIDVMQKEFAPETIIGSNVSSKVFEEYPYEQDDKLINNSLLFMLLDKSDPSNIPSSGVYLEPDLKGYNAFDFAKAKALIDSGYSETIRNIEEIKRKVNRRVKKEERSNSRKEFIHKGEPFRFSNINFHGYNSKQRIYIKKLFKLEDNPLTLEEIKAAYFKMVSEKYFSSVYPDIGFNQETNQYSLELYGRPRSNVNVSVGGAIATRNISQIYLGAEYYYFDNYLLKNSLSFYAGGFYKSALIRSRLYLASPTLFYIEPELVYNNWDFLNSDDIFLDDDSPTLLTRTDRKYGLNIGLPFGNKFVTVFSGSHINNEDEFSNTPGITSIDTLDLLELNGSKVGLKIGRNNFNRKQYPSEGKELSFSFDYFNIREKYRPGTTSTIDSDLTKFHEWIKISGRWEQYFKAGKWSTGYLVQGVYSAQPKFSSYFGTLINLPSFNPLQDSRTLLLQNFRAFSYAAFGLKNVLAIRSNLDFRIEGYIYKPFELLTNEGELFGRSPDRDQIFLVGNASLVLHSPIGPISINTNYYDDNETQWGVLLHVGFLLFNNNSLDY